MTLVVDDTQLIRLAVEPPRDAARLLRRTAAYRPLVWCSAIVPVGVWALIAGMTSESAQWALRATAVQHATQLEQWLVPGVQWPDCGVMFQPPLAAWLNALVLPWLPPALTGGTVIVSSLSIVGAVYLFWQWLREVAGERIALLATLLFAFHSQVAPLAATAGPEALTLLMFIALAWGMWGHLHHHEGLVSLRQLCAGIAWGLALLASGPVALGYLLLLVLWGATSRGTPMIYSSPMGGRVAFRSVLLLLLTGAALAAWWPTMMLQHYGLPFAASWCGFESSAPTSVHWSNLEAHRWGTWLQRGAFLGGWWCLGFVTAARVALTASVTAAVRWARWLVLWTLIGVAGRVLYGVCGATDAAIHSWEVFLAVPATILSAQGVDRVLRRETTRLMLATVVAITIGGVVWRFAHHLGWAVMIGGAMLLLLLASAPLAIGVRRASYAWSEAEIRRWVIAAAVVTFVGHAALSFAPVWHDTLDRRAWEQVRQRLAAVDHVDQASIVAADGPDQAPWLYLVHATWPKARVSHNPRWEPQIAETIIREASHPRSQILLLEWNRRGLGFLDTVGTGWQVQSILEPRAFRGRRLAAHLISPNKPPSNNP